MCKMIVLSIIFFHFNEIFVIWFEKKSNCYSRKQQKKNCFRDRKLWCFFIIIFTFFFCLHIMISIVIFWFGSSENNNFRENIHYTVLQLMKWSYLWIVLFIISTEIEDTLYDLIFFCDARFPPRSYLRIWNEIYFFDYF